MKNTSQVHKKRIIIAIIIAVLLGMGVLIVVFMNGFKNGSEGNSAIYPQDGTYTVTNVDGITCSKTPPPICRGGLELTPGDPERIGAEIDGDTKVRYEQKEIQIYPSILKRGMRGTVTFKPDSAIIDTMVIDE